MVGLFFGLFVGLTSAQMGTIAVNLNEYNFLPSWSRGRVHLRPVYHRVNTGAEMHNVKQQRESQIATRHVPHHSKVLSTVCISPLPANFSKTHKADQLLRNISAESTNQITLVNECGPTLLTLVKLQASLCC